MTTPRNLPLLLAGLALIAASLACGAGSPAATAQPSVSEPPSILPTSGPSISGPGQEPAMPPAIPERRRITLEYPPRIRSGDSDIIRLTLEMDPDGNLTPTAETEGNTVTGQRVQIPNLYETHNVTVEARLDMAGMEVKPPEVISAPLAPGLPVTFYWSVRPQDKGNFKGTAWLFLKFTDKITGEESRRPLSAQVIEISSSDILGLPANLARTTGAVGSVVGGIIGFPFFEDILKFILKRRRKQ